MIYLFAAFGCVLLGIALIWKATHRVESEHRAKFVFGMLGLMVLGVAVAVCPQYMQKLDRNPHHVRAAQ